MAETGDLIGLYLDLVQASPEIDPERWQNVTVVLAVHMAPGLAAGVPQDGTAETRQRWLHDLGDAMFQILEDADATEEFIVAAAVDQGTRYYQSMADTGGADEHRQATRLGMLRTLSNPAELEALRQSMSADEGREVPLDELRRGLQGAADRLGDTSPDEAAEKWEQFEAWKRDVDAILPADLLYMWSYRQRPS